MTKGPAPQNAGRGLFIELDPLQSATPPETPQVTRTSTR